VAHPLARVPQPFTRAAPSTRGAQEQFLITDRDVRIVPDVSVSGANANPGVVDGLLGLTLRNQANGQGGPK